MRKLYCYSFKDFSKLVESWGGQAPENSIIISIISSPSLRGDNEYHLLHGDNVLNLEFDDITDKDTIIPNTKLFDLKLAQEIYEFIENNIESGCDIYVHCSAGVSRSQAIIKYILNNYPGYDWETRKDNPCQFPNYYVLGLLNRVYRAYLEKVMSEEYDDWMLNEYID